MAAHYKNYDAIIAGLTNIKKTINTINEDADMLLQEANAAESVLQDEVAKKNIEAVRALVKAIHKATQEGLDREKKLERKVNEELAEWKRLKSMSR